MSTELLRIFLGLFIVFLNVLSFGIIYSHALQNGLVWNNACNDDTTISESLLLLKNNAGFATSMAIISAQGGACILFFIFYNFPKTRVILSILYILGLIFFSVLPFVVMNNIPTYSIAPLPDVPTTAVVQEYNPIGHQVLAGLYGFCMCICIFVSTGIYVKYGSNIHCRNMLLVIVACVVVLLISFFGSVLDSSTIAKGCTEQNTANKWFTITEFIFQLIVNIWIITITFAQIKNGKGI